MTDRPKLADQLSFQHRTTLEIALRESLLSWSAVGTPLASRVVADLRSLAEEVGVRPE